VIRTALFWVITQRVVVVFLPTFRNNLSVASTLFKNPKINPKDGMMKDV